MELRKEDKMKKYIVKNTRSYQVCSNCVMDTTDSKIVFDKNGKCDFCIDFEKNIIPNWHPIQNNPKLLEVAKKIKKANRKNKYDCIIGFSGGVDSSYLCYVAKKIMKLNPLALVVDTGWNLSVADENIKTISTKLGIDVEIVVIDWDDMKDLQIAFLKSGVPYQDLPQDHAIFATLYMYAVKHKIKYVLTGANNATEYVRPPIEWVYQNDIKFIKDVYKKHGSNRKLTNFPFCGLMRFRLVYPLFYGMKRFAPLNYLPYDKKNIQSFLINELGWKTYENKHFEDRFTRWYEGYYLIKKFGYDKRKCYLSNLILTGEISRDQALSELKENPYSENMRKEDEVFISQKLGISVSELNSYVSSSNKSFEDYKNSFGLIQFGTKVLRLLKIEKKKFR